MEIFKKIIDIKRILEPGNAVEKVSNHHSEFDDVGLKKEPALSEIKKLIKRLDSDDKYEVWEILEILTEAKSHADFIVRAFKKGKKRRKVNLAYVLGRIGDEKAIETLIDSLSSKDWEIRWACAIALGEVKGVDEDRRETIAVKLAELLKDESWDVRRAAATSLGKLKCRAAVKPLLEALKSERMVRFETAKSLAEIGCDSEDIIPLLEHPDIDVRCKAIEILGEIGDKKAAEHLIRFLEADDAGLRRTAAAAIEKLGEWQELVDYLETPSNRKGRYYVLRALRGFINIPRVYEAILNALRDEDEEVRYAALLILAEIGDIRAVKGIVKALGDESDAVKRAAFTILLRIGEECIPYIEEEIKKAEGEYLEILETLLEKIREESRGFSIW
jgi:HEAT repeat protein